MEEILARAKKVAQAAEVYTTSITETPVQFESNRLKNIQSKQSTSVALRVMVNGRIGYATSSRVDDIQDLVDNAVATAAFGAKAEFEFSTRQRFTPVEVYDPAVNKVTLAQMTGLGEKIIAAVNQHSPDVLCEGSVTKMVAELHIANSLGGKAGYKKSVFAMSIDGQRVRGTDMLFVGDGASSCHPVLDPKSIIATITEQLELAKNPAAISSKAMPVIFTPEGVASALVMPLMSAFNGKTVLEGASPIGQKLGEQVFDANLTVNDDPTIPFRPGSQPCDDEGIPCRKHVMIQNGVVNGFLYDLQTAAKAKTKSTGNGNRGGGSLPSPSWHAFVLEGGKASFQSMVKGIKEGLVVEQLMGAGQGNVLGGDFSGNVLLGYKIENGQIVGRVKDTMVSGNIYTMLKNIAAIGSDSKWVGGSLSTPSLYFQNVSVASR
ncbi:MAG: TldD/PmbA family protein [Dehalococcoidales bacterium]|nr:TldD/PmbA family protein [Dehalococcoidales bacterium]